MAPPLMPFEAVVERYGATVLRVVRAALDPIDADDAWSETFLAALRAYPSLSPDAGVEAWLVTIARRKAIDLHRARARRAVPVAEAPEVAVSDPTSGAAHDSDLIRAVGELPARQRSCVAYHYLADLPYDDIAALLGGTPAAARRAAADGIAALRRTYPDRTFDD